MANSKVLPKFKTRKEVAEFWDTHSSMDYWDQFEDVELKVHPSIKSPRDLSPRCPHHKNQVLYTRWRTIDIADGFASLHKVRELYCPRGDYTRLAPETAKIVKQAEAALKRVQLKFQKLAA
ncbi:MAG: hypothetical protein FJ009_03540 [Chloroflexi bacterium]|nr:hypothetical protein [Chloroflexota bacterium]